MTIGEKASTIYNERLGAVRNRKYRPRLESSQALSRQAIGFLAVGLLAGIVNVLVRIVLNRFISYEAAVALAFPIALTLAFVLNRNHIFDASGGDVSSQYIKFAIINVLSLAQVWVISVVLANYVFPATGFSWHSEIVAHAVGVFSPAVTNFFAYRYFVFRGPSNSTRSEPR